MQIHELSRRTVKEALAGDFASGVAGKLAQNFVQGQTGAASDQFAGQRVAQGQRPAAGLAMNAPALQLMAKKAQESWGLTQQELARSSVPPVASAAELPVAELKPRLAALISQLVGFDYATQPAADPAAPEVALGVKSARNFINQEIDQILRLGKQNPEQTKQQLTTSWQELVQKGIGPLQTYAQSVARAAPAARTQMRSDAAALAKTIGQAGTQAIAQQLQGKQIPKTGIPAIDGLFTQLGATLR